MKFSDIVQFYSPLGGGVKRYLHNKMYIFSQDPAIEHFVIVPSNRTTVSKEQSSKLYEIKSLPLIGSISYRMLLNKKKILRIVKKEQPDLIEVGDPYRSAWIALRAAQKFDIPIVAFYHSDFPRALGRTIGRFCGKSLERLLSNSIQRYIQNLYNQMNATVVASRRMEHVLKECGIQRVVRIPLGTNCADFQPNPDGATKVRNELQLSEKDTLLLFVGRLAREKNIHSLLDVMEQLPNQNQQGGRYHLLLVGDGELQKYTEAFVKKNSRVTWYRYSESIEQLTAYYTAADIFTHAGNYETFGITSLEAQACGTPVLAIRNGGLDDTLVGEQPLIMADSPDASELASCIQQIEQIPFPQTAEERRARILNHFSITLTFQRLTDLYKHILENKPVEEFIPRNDCVVQAPKLESEAILTN